MCIKVTVSFLNTIFFKILLTLSRRATQDYGFKGLFHPFWADFGSLQKYSLYIIYWDLPLHSPAKYAEFRFHMTPIQPRAEGERRCEFWTFNCIFTSFTSFKDLPPSKYTSATPEWSPVTLCWAGYIDVLDLVPFIGTEWMDELGGHWGEGGLAFPA